jgi:hypothetical protein
MNSRRVVAPWVRKDVVMKKMDQELILKLAGAEEGI